MVGHSRKSKGCTESALLTSQLHKNYQASQAEHGADDVTTPHFYSQVNLLSICGPQVDALIYSRGLECPTLFNQL